MQLPETGDLESARRSLSLSVLLFVLILGALFLLLLNETYSRLYDWALLQNQRAAEDVADVLEKRLNELLAQEDERPTEHYRYFVATKPAKGDRPQLQESPLSRIPPQSIFPGVIGFFEFFPDRPLQSPILPIEPIQDFLSSHDVFTGIDFKVRKTKLAELSAIAAPVLERFGDLTASSLKSEANGSAGQSSIRRERTILLSTSAQEIPNNVSSASVRFTETEVQVRPFSFFPAHNLNGIFIRQISDGEKEGLQGFVVNTSDLARVLFIGSIPTNTMARNAAFTLSVAGHPVFATKELPIGSDGSRGISILKRTLLAPTSQLDLTVTLSELNLGPSLRLLKFIAVILFFTLFLGSWGLYRVGILHFRVAQQQARFISSITHELRTPLTSIRMYSEMLREGWVQDEAKRSAYYDFIFSESERLSRLISNVLRVSELSNNPSTDGTRPVSLHQVAEIVESKIVPFVRAARFELNLEPRETWGDKVTILLDLDGFTQILLNLVDNAVKYSVSDDLQATKKQIDISAKIDSSTATFFIRDYGPGIRPDQLEHVFELFYRGDDGATRRTPGTGIGLALVKQLTESMGGRVRVENRDPGVEFQLEFPIISKHFVAEPPNP